MFSFMRNHKLSSKLVAPFYIYTSNNEYCFSISLSAFGVAIVQGFGPFDDICGTSFHMLIYHVCNFFGEVSVKVFGPFLNQFVCFLNAEL